MSDIDRVTIAVKIGKEGAKAEPVDLTKDLRSLTYEDDEKKADKLTFVLENYDLRFWDDDTFKKGNTVIVSWGYAGNMQSSECIIERLSGGAAGDFVVEAIHKSFLLHKNTKSRVFENATRSEVAQKIATEAGYQAVIQDTTVRHRLIHQHNLTDGEFLKRLANREGFEYFVDSSGFHFHERKFDDAPIRTLTYFTDSVGEIVDWHYESEKKKKGKGKVTTEGRDPLKKKDFAVESKNSTVPRTSLADVLEVVDGQTGQTTNQSRSADDHTQPTSEASHAAAKAGADASFKKSQHATHKLSLTVVGDPKLAAKRVILVQGISKRLSGRWYVDKCRHEVEDSGQYLTKLECKRDGHNGFKGASKDAKTDGSTNTKATDEGPRQLEVVSGVTGETHTEWRK